MKYFLIFALLSFAPLAHAQSASVTEKARVTSIISEQIQNVSGTNESEESQTLQALVLSGPDTGKSVEVGNDYIALEIGDTFFLTENAGQYVASAPDRLPALGVLAAFFVVVLILVGGWTGVRSLLALAASFFVVAYALLPAITHGYNPLAISLGAAALIIIFGSYLTHGVSRATSAAVIGMIATVACTAVIAYIAVHATKLSGMGDENTLDLVSATGLQINFVGLLLGAMLIGILGILYDAAIGQAVAVEELIRATPQASRVHIFTRAIRIGREHIGALVNTLVIAYVGISLPLLLLFQSYAEPFLQTINQEVFATEIVRAMVGAVGIMLVVPVTTLVALLMLSRKLS